MEVSGGAGAGGGAGVLALPGCFVVMAAGLGGVCWWLALRSRGGGGKLLRVAAPLLLADISAAPLRLLSLVLHMNRPPHEGGGVFLVQ